MSPKQAPPSATHQAVLRPGDPNSIDFGISLLLDVLPGLSLSGAIRRYITAEVQGGAPICWGSKVEMDRVSEALARERMIAEVEVIGSTDPH